MRLAVIGANGKSGKAFVRAALAAGYEVRAGIHGEPLNAQKNLTQVRIDAMNHDDIHKLCADADVIVSLIGHGKHSPKWLQTETIKHCIDEANQGTAQRIISLTGTGVRVQGDRPSLIDRILNRAIAVIDPDRINDGKQHAAELAKSAVDYTIIRVLKLGNGSFSNRNVVMTEHGPAELLTSRHKVAQAILQVIHDDAYHRQLPVVSG